MESIMKCGECVFHIVGYPRHFCTVKGGCWETKYYCPTDDCHHDAERVAKLCEQLGLTVEELEKVRDEQAD